MGAQTPTPGQGIDPTSIEYRVHAHAFNALTRALPDDLFMILSDRQAIASAIVEAIEPLIRTDEREHAAPDLELAKIATERNQYRMALEKISGGEVGNGIAALRKIAVRALEQQARPAPADGMNAVERAARDLIGIPDGM
jgi:hypothetical protein